MTGVPSRSVPSNTSTPARGRERLVSIGHAASAMPLFVMVSWGVHGEQECWGTGRDQRRETAVLVRSGASCAEVFENGISGAD
eukprot:2429903-Rhodomonas_salina.1